jgi:hypothetical protein
MKDVQEIFLGKMYRHMNQYLISEQNMDLRKNKFILFRTKNIPKYDSTKPYAVYYCPGFKQ